MHALPRQVYFLLPPRGFFFLLHWITILYILSQNTWIFLFVIIRNESFKFKWNILEGIKEWKVHKGNNNNVWHFSEINGRKFSESKNLIKPFMWRRKKSVMKFFFQLKSFSFYEYWRKNFLWKYRNIFFVRYVVNFHCKINNVRKKNLTSGLWRQSREASFEILPHKYFHL